MTQWLRLIIALAEDQGSITAQHLHGGSGQPVTPAAEDPLALVVTCI